MSNIVLLGGNGYIGRNTTKAWMERDKEAKFYVVSRSGKNALKDKRIINIQADVTSSEDMKAKLPAQVDYIVDFIGAAAVPKGSSQTLTEFNMAPAKEMKVLAEYYHVKAQGAIGGKLGSKEFVASKKAMIDYLKQSDVPTEVVEPTLVYGAGRKDSLTKMVPLLKFCGIFSKKMKPVKVEEVADELVTKMMSHQ